MNRLLVPLAAVLLAAVAGCSNTSSVGANGGVAGAAARGTAEDPSTVVATIGDKKITLGDLDKSIRGKLSTLEREHRQKLHELRQGSLEGMVAKQLMEAEAKKRGMSEEDMLRAEVEGKTAAPSDEEIRAFYDQNAGAPGLPPFDQAKERIGQFLTAQKQQKAVMDFLDKLKTDAKVEITLAEPEAPAVHVEAIGPSRGAKDAPVTIVEFSDFECPFCSRANATLTQVEEAYAGKVRVVFRDYPLPFHASAQKAAEAGHCADEQGKFWELHDKMFGNQRALGVDELKGYAKELGLDSAKFDACLDGGKMAEKVSANAEAGEEAGVTGTPAFFINGKLLSGALPFDEFKKVIDAELAKAGVKTAEN
ncbi:thioredoxin domain-containing protein [Vulgatibacter incomptus]|uniref:Periplasmic thiol:disulfide interchange protein DsbA n=1 Tax=Vulgatibacter incomptus TaxID=1391653 RepID=A0A0K1PCS7_9BACT|nr:thioredoxin domain-containing protein [Vulgatibacter incomptus]AKU91343.1 Periplasmic thiol:disulfide interchange protein DsbA [Vulgatibacter incomptus]